MGRKIMPVQQCEAVNALSEFPPNYAELLRKERNAWYGWEPSKLQVAEYALKKLEEAWQKDQDTHEANLEALENNKVIAQQIKDFMEDIGMPNGWSEPNPKSRARIPPRIHHVAGYLQDIQRWVITSDGFQEAKARYDRLKKDFTTYYNYIKSEAEAEARRKEQEAERKRKERLENMELATMLVRYGLDVDCDWHDVLDVLRKKDQRLNLAIAMLDTRLDWNDGFYRVIYALNDFEAETDEDKEIVDCISKLLESNIRDGRIFRDCEWNYDRLFDSIEDRQLVEDAMKARDKIREEYW